MRSHLLPRLVDSIQATTESYRIVVMAATGECAETAKALGTVDVIEDGGGTWSQRINHGFKMTTEPYIFTCGDDLVFHPGWYEAAMRCMDQIPGGGVVATNDLHNPAGVHFLVSRDYINTFGGYKDGQGIVFFEGFRHQYSDDAIRQTARSRGKFMYCEDSRTEHMHPGAGKGPMDATYQLGESTAGHDGQVFRENAELWV